MEPSLTLESFRKLAEKYSVVPIALEVLGDRNTPVSVFEQLVRDGDGFLLESVEGGERWGRWSFIGWDPAFTVSSKDGVATVDDPTISVVEGDPLDVLADLTARFTTPDEAEMNLSGPLPPLHTGAVGYLGYDVVRYVEHLPDRPLDDRQLPEMAWQFVGSLAAFDRLRDAITLIRNVYVTEDHDADYVRATAALSDAAAKLTDLPSTRTTRRPAFDTLPDATANMTREMFEDTVRTAVDYIVAGDAFQIVPSIRFEAEFSGDAF
jgi:anthranilate synthase component 1